MNSASGPIAQYVRQTLAVAAMSLAGFTATHAQTIHAAAQSFDIPAQNTSDALNAFSRQSGLRILFSFDAVAGQTAGAIRGTYAPEEVLRKILDGSELTYDVTADSVVVVHDKRATQASGEGYPQSWTEEGPGGASSSISLAQADVPTGGELEEIVVTSKRFKENDAFGATKMGMALKDTPQTVLVVTEDLIKASGMKTFNDLYKVDASGGSAHTLDNFPRNWYRGFAQQGINAIRVDGFRMPGNIDLDFATIDRIEVIKGATSTLYGQSEVGGSLNAVSKLPQDKFGAKFGLEAGQFNAYRLDADVTGPLGASDVWSYRLIGAYSDADSFLDFANEQRKLFSSAIQYELSDATRFMLRATLQETSARHHFAPALQFAGTGTGTRFERALDEGFKIADVPRSRFYGMPWNRSDINAKFIQFQGEHRFANDWQLRAHAQYNRVRYVSDALAVEGPFDENGFAYSDFSYSQDNLQDLYGAEVNLFGKVALFGREHTLFFGADYSREGQTVRSAFQFLSQGAYEDFPFRPLDPHPDYSAVPRIGLNDYANLYDYDGESELYGATVQLVLNPADRIKVLLGARYSVDTFLPFRTRSGAPDEIDGNSFVTSEGLNFHNTTIQTGATYKLTDAVNLYATYGETFEPSGGRVFEGDGLPGKLIDPERGKAYEAGAKADLSKDLALTLAIFQIERTNIAQGDPVHPQFLLPLGTQRSRGVELSAQGRLLPPLSLFASVAYLDAEFSQGEFKGLQPANAPRFGVSVFGSYEILDGDMKGLGFGLGVVHKSGLETFDAVYTLNAGAPVTFDFSGFTEVDANVYYGRNRWNVTLSATNLLDEKYFSPSFERLSSAIHVNPPRMLRMSVGYRF